MQLMSIYAIYPKANLSKRNCKESIVPHLLRNYAVNFPNQVWSIDITYIPMPMCHMYLTAIIDWYSRKIVSHYLSDTLDTESVIHTVKEAVSMHGIPAILNDDQGCQFTSAEYKALLKGLQIRQSMDGKSRWADNIMIECWFR
ncbi:MAG: transposase [Dialister sp.]|nr:transposase [Dialister sp.]